MVERVNKNRRKSIRNLKVITMSDDLISSFGLASVERLLIGDLSLTFCLDLKTWLNRQIDIDTAKSLTRKLEKR